jgi:hypothetical protein
MTESTEAGADSMPKPVTYTRLRENVPVTATATVYEGPAPLMLLLHIGTVDGDHGDHYEMEINHSGSVLRVTGQLGSGSAGEQSPDQVPGHEETIVVDLDLRTLLQQLCNLAGWSLGVDMGDEARGHPGDALKHLETVKGMQVALDAAALLAPNIGDKIDPEVGGHE